MSDFSVLPYKIAFASLRSINPLMATEILARTGTEQAFFDIPSHTLSAMMGMSNAIFDDDYRAKLLINARREADFIEASGITPVYFSDPCYPSRLTHCEDAPVMLYKLGDADMNPPLSLAVVGTRHATPYGLDFTERLVADLAEKLAEPVTIVSGLAFGIDIAAHRAALKCGLPTVAVLAHGLNTIYPAMHRSDAAAIVRSNGALLTEYASSAPVHKGNFVARNRIVAGLCDALIVVESAEKGGALITANLAVDYHRDVFALPGRTSDRYSRGCNRIIGASVAALVQSADDIIEAMGWHVRETAPVQRKLFPEVSPREQTILDVLAAGGDLSINRLSALVDINVGRLTGILIDMEMRGLIIKYPGGKYRQA